MPIISVKANVAPGTAFIRYCQALAVSKGSTLQAVEYAKRWHDSTPEVELVLKAAVAAGTTTDATWAGPLAPIKPLTDEFLALLRPATILGKVAGLRQGAVQRVGRLADRRRHVSVGRPGRAEAGRETGLRDRSRSAITKCAGIIVITEELARTSTPSAEEVIRRDMIAGIAAFLDQQFIDPADAAVAGVSPGSVTNGVTPITTAGTVAGQCAHRHPGARERHDGAQHLDRRRRADPVGDQRARVHQRAQPARAAAVSRRWRRSGGTIMGYKAVASQAAGTTVALVQPNAILYADDGGVTIDVSREASLQMDTALDNPPLATTLLTSLWQNNLVGLRAERFINWKKARTGVVQYTVATYTA